MPPFRGQANEPDNRPGHRVWRWTLLSLLWTAFWTALFAPARLVLFLFARLLLSGRRVLRVPLGASRLGDPPLSPAEAVLLLDEIAKDRRIRAIVLDLRGLSGGFAAVEDLRAAVLRLRSAGKLVVTHLDGVTLKDLSLAAAADRIWLTPSGESWLMPLGTEQMHLAGAFARFGVQVQMLSAGTFKSFAERYSRSAPSPAARVATETVLQGIQDQVLNNIASDRRISRAPVDSLLESSPAPAEALLAAGIVDALYYPDQAKEGLSELLDGAGRPRGLAGWDRLRRWDRFLSGASQRSPRILVVHLEGPVVMGAEAMGGGGPRIDADRVCAALDALSPDWGLSAVVLAINSPGGSALASDLIGRSVQRLGARLPTIAVLGDVAASGGYYIAAPAAEIIARPSTITGSIGVVGGKLVFREAAARFGVHAASIGLGADAGLMSAFQPWTPDQERRYEASMRRTYARFLAVVAGGRGRPVAAIEPFAQGRIWTGRQALAHGLVDHLGDLSFALERARIRAGLDSDTATVGHLHFRPPRMRVLQTLLGLGQARVGPDLWGAAADSLGPLSFVLSSLWKNPGEPLVIAPLELDLAWAKTVSQ